ncbi:putative phage abortive infection protein [uncultured Microbulbifer sp.]|uniref:putative phage abortive infection protein n=1 Tax=uncultured Microbulbifer sp. TaxID=348147 RepID=UPI00260F0978|nr:putative phage abortive infection protein [uncultured Microbulbifer sp.]
MSSEKEQDVSGWLKVISIIAFVIALVILILYFSKFAGDLASDHSRWAEFGDYLGGVLNPFFALLGLIALLITIHIQSKEMREARKGLASQNTTLFKQNFEHSFFQMLRIHNDIVNSIDFVRQEEGEPPVVTKGRDCFRVMVKRLKKTYNDKNINFSNQLNINAGYKEFYNKHQGELGHYFRFLYNIYKFIDNAEIDNPAFYANLVKAQVSNYELVILFYNCFSRHGKEKFLPLAKKYNLFDNMPSNILLLEAHITWLSASDKVKSEAEEIEESA